MRPRPSPLPKSRIRAGICAGFLVVMVSLLLLPGKVTGSVSSPETSLLEGLSYRLDGRYQAAADPPLGVIEEPSGLHVAADGTVFVSDRALHRVQRFGQDGEPIVGYGRQGKGPGELFFPQGVATDLGRDRLYVADTENGRVAVFGLDGSFVENLDGFPLAESVAVGLDGRLFVQSGPRIDIHPLTGPRLESITLGSLLGRIPGVGGGMVVGRDGRLYVATGYGVYRFDPDGRSAGLGARQLYGSGAVVTRDLDFDESGELFVLEPRHLRFRRPGGLVLGYPVEERVLALAAGADGEIHMIVAATPDRPAGVIVRHFEQGRLIGLRDWGIPQTVVGWLRDPLRIAVHGPDLFVVDDLRRVQRFDAELEGASGQLLLKGLSDVEARDDRTLIAARMRFGASTESDEDPDQPGPGQQAIRIERLDLPIPLGPESAANPPDPIWRHVDEDPVLAAGATRIAGIARDALRGRTWALDAGRERLLVLDESDGHAIREIALPEVRAGYSGWTDLAVDPDGKVLVLHGAAARAWRFGPAGEPMGWIELPQGSWRIATGPDGGIFVPTTDRWVWSLDPEGSVRTVWALPPPAFGNRHPPSDLTVDEAGRVFLLDQSNGSILRYAAQDQGPVASRPPPGRLVCRLQLESQADRAEVLIGEALTVTVRIHGSCDAHPRLATRPERLLHSARLAITLPAQLDLVSGGSLPPAIEEEKRLSWELGAIGPEGMTLQYTLRARSSSPWPVAVAGQMDYLDGWFGFGAIDMQIDRFYALLPPTPEPAGGDPADPLPERPARLILPWIEH